MKRFFCQQKETEKLIQVQGECNNEIARGKCMIFFLHSGEM